MKLAWRIGWPIFAVMLLSLGLLGFLNLYKFEQLLDDVARARVSVTAIDSKLAIEQSLALGLLLADVQNIQAIIDRARAFDPVITAVLVVDFDKVADGRILFASGTTPADVPSRWRGLQAKAGNGSWHQVSARGHLVMGWPLVDPLHGVTGMMVFDVSRQHHLDMVASTAARIGKAVAILGGVLALAIALLMAWLLHPVERSIVRAAAIIAGEQAEQPDTGTEIEALAFAFLHAVDAVAPEVRSDGTSGQRK